MSEDFYPFVDSGDPAPSNTHLTGMPETSQTNPDVKTKSPDGGQDNSGMDSVIRAARISVYDDMLSTPRVIVIEQSDVRTYLEEITNTVYRTMKEQGGHLNLMIVRELVENFIHAHFNEPIISILDNGDTIRFSDQGPGIDDKELAFEFGITSANREQKRYIRGTGSGLPMIQQYVENAGGAIAIEDNLGAGTVVTVSVNPERVLEIEQSVSRGAAVRSGHQQVQPSAAGNATPQMGAAGYPSQTPQANTMGYQMQQPNSAVYPVQQASAAPYPVQQAGTTPYPVPQSNPVGMMPNQYSTPQQGFYPQFDNQFSTNQQYYTQPAGMYTQTPIQQAAAPVFQNPYISERGMLALRFLMENTQGGPTDLTRLYGSSNGTWSRELATLSKAGFVHKPGQKYVLTDMGRAWIQNQRSE